MKQEVWYRNFDNFKIRISELDSALSERCDHLKISPEKVLEEFMREFVTRAVHESNWQEGLELEKGKTQKMANAAFDDCDEIAGPHLDMVKILSAHRRSVQKMKKAGLSTEEIGAYNLTKAYQAAGWVAFEMTNRYIASLAKTLSQATEKLLEKEKDGKQADSISAKTAGMIEKNLKLLREIESDRSPVEQTLTKDCKTLGEMAVELMKVDASELIHPMNTRYIHFLHQLILTGIMPSSKIGKFRKASVHVGNFDLYFPPPSAVNQLMAEYCRNFPRFMSRRDFSDPIWEAAKASHRFTAIHPYEDGNGRVSRLIMNLLLWRQFPPVYIKADKKGRHRYGFALKRADRGDFRPLASLIAMSIIDAYEKVIRSLASN